MLGLDGFDLNDDPASVTVVAIGAERLKQAGADALARHLHETQRRHFGNLVAGAVAAQAFDESAQHEVAVAFQHHVDEVDDDDAADIAQTQLTHDFFGRFEVVLGDGLFEVSARTGELSGVDVDDGHRLSAIDDKRAARRQEYLAVKSLGDLFFDAQGVEDILVAGVPALEAIDQVGSDVIDVARHHVPGVIAFDDQTAEVLIEEVAHDLDHQVGLGIEESGRVAGLHLAFDVFPACGERADVADQLVLGRPFGGRTDDDAGIFGEDVLEERLQTSALGVRQLARNAARLSTGDIDEKTTGQTHLAGQSCALLADRVLADLHEDRLTRGQHVFDFALLAVAEGRPVDFAGIKDRIATLADVDEGGFHAGQNVLDFAEVDVADEGSL